MSPLYAAVSAALYGLADFLGGYATAKNKVLSVLVVSQAMGLLTAIAAAAAAGSGPPTIADLAWGAAGGVAGAFGIVALYRGIAGGVVAIVSPTAAAVGAALPLAVGLAGGDRPGPAAIAGACLCVPAIILLASSPAGDRRGGAEARSSLLLGALAGLGFGLFYVALSRPGPGTGFWPLVAARSASISLALLVMAARRERPALARGSGAATVVSGVADMGANIFFVAAAGKGMLSLVALIVSLYPALTVLLARWAFKERIGRTRGLGLALSLAGLALLSVK